MKSRILTLLANGPKTEAELATHFDSSSMPKVRAVIEKMTEWGLIAMKVRQVHEGNNVFHWENEYSLEGIGDEDNAIDYSDGFGIFLEPLDT